MGKFLKKFSTDSARVEYEDSENYLEPYVSYVEGDNTVHYNKPPFFCKLTLSDDSVVELEGSGELTQTMVSDIYKNTLVSVEVGELCTSIGNGAFSHCSALTEATISSSVTSLGYNVFEYCTSLTNVNIPNNVTAIMAGTFKTCSNLSNITIPNSVTSIGGGAFAYCTSLTNVVMGNSITYIDGGAFAYCSSLQSITIPSSVSTMIINAFQECTSLETIYAYPTIAPTIQSGFWAYVKEGGVLYYPSGSDYSSWMGNDGNLGFRNWTSQGIL